MPILLSSASVVDGLGRTVRVTTPPRRIVSLVPSLTEAIFAMGLGERVIGRTAYCVEPAALVGAVPAVGGTKTPDVARIAAMAPDLVIASAEENVREHVEALIAAGLTVYISLPETVERALIELADLATLTGHSDDAAPWLNDARDAAADLRLRRRTARPLPYFCPIWRRPYMVASSRTYMSDFLALCGGASIFGEGPARYYPVELADIAAGAPELILLPSEPYPFAAKHIAEVAAIETPAARDGRIHLIDGQAITWYGSRIGPSLRAIAALFEAA